jgi:hypothetical protein
MPSMKEYSPFVPFDLYDFFGYLFPSVVFFSCIMIFFNWHDNSVFWPWIAFIESSHWFVNLLLLVFGIIALYVLGHFIAMISYILIDRVFLEGMVKRWQVLTFDNYYI